MSEITAIECEQLLDLRPQVVTPNGFEKIFVPPRSRFKKERQSARKLMLEAASALVGTHTA